MKNVNIIVPCHNEEENIDDFIKAINNLEQVADFEMIFVDDGSSDNTWQKLREQEGIVAVKLSRNFGKEAAILAGITRATGDACIIIDADLQHPPEKIVEMINIWQKNSVDVVEGIKSNRGRENIIYKIFSKLFYFVMGDLQTQGASDFQLIDRKVINVIVAMPEKQRFFRALSKWVGFRRERVYYEVGERTQGVSKFNFWSSFRYAVKNISSFNAYPMQFVTFMGMIFFVLSLILGGITIYQFITNRSLEGFTTVILLLLIIGSVIMFSLGIIGYYIGKIYEEIKQRPIYLIEEEISPILFENLS